MNAQTKLSAKGQVVIPKDVRDELHWTQGQALDVVRTAEGVLLKATTAQGRLSVQEAVARIRARWSYAGPPVSVEDIDDAIADMYRNAPDERF